MAFKRCSVILLLLSLLFTFSLSTAQEATPAPDASPLQAFAEQPTEVVAELVERGLIPKGGSLILRQDFTFFSGQGFTLVPMAVATPRTHVVMAAQLAGQSGAPNQLEVCALAARVGKTTDKGDVSTFVSVGLSNRGDLTLIDRAVEGEEPTALQAKALNIDFSQPHHLLFILYQDRLTIFVDGKLTLRDVSVVERSGSYGLALAAGSSKTRCEGRGLWVYQIASPDDPCVVNATRAVNKRGGPGTTFDNKGQLLAGQKATVTKQAQGTDGQTWWGLVDDSWVRGDLVTATGACETLPVEKP